MSRYIKSFENDAAIQSAVDNGVLSKPYVAYDESANTIDWNSKINFKEIPLTFEIISDGVLNIYNPSSYVVGEYKINNGEFITINANESVSLNVKSNDKVVYKISNWGYYRRAFSGSTAGFIVYGNPKLDVANIDSNNFTEAFRNCTGLTDASNLVLPTTLSNNSFNKMFYGCTSLTTAPELPATTLAINCYMNMFYGCTSLTSAPELPATTLVQGCYSNMFEGCTSLTKAPSILPATTLADSCYSDMFRRCTSLTTAPELPATTLAPGCYKFMFYDSSNLNYIKCLATDISATNCTQFWIRGVASSGTFVKNPNMLSWTTGTSGIPTNWTVIDA